MQHILRKLKGRFSKFCWTLEGFRISLLSSRKKATDFASEASVKRVLCVCPGAVHVHHYQHFLPCRPFLQLVAWTGFSTVRPLAWNL